ncbi:hypothetical protein BN946_scf184693.g2 [Trametes cinnabarina]|uniref:Uncharacterized protein n=1 Tax=Pycnoporus cinnabarinus TaxID=5643 RepID=A0A060SSK6_PYCCI|nr:hypothetical protein BN946_scf184693.g2 [Trametes cinnabarina]
MSAPPSSCLTVQAPGRYDALPTTVEGFTEAIMKAEDSQPELRVLRDVGETVQDVKAIFERIGESLAQFDNVQFFDSQDHLLQLNWQWREYAEVGLMSTRALAERSAYKASAVGALLRQYNKAIMTNVERAAVAKLTAELLPFVEKLGAKVVEIRRIASDFQTIRQDVTEFRLTIETYISKARLHLEDERPVDFLDVQRFMARLTEKVATQNKQRSLVNLQGILEAQMNDLERAAQAHLQSTSPQISTDMVEYSTQLERAVDPDLPINSTSLEAIGLHNGGKDSA